MFFFCLQLIIDLTSLTIRISNLNKCSFNLIEKFAILTRTPFFLQPTQEPYTPQASQKGTQIVRPDGRIVVIPPIERPTTRSRNKKEIEKAKVVAK